MEAMSKSIERMQRILNDGVGVYEAIDQYCAETGDTAGRALRAYDACVLRPVSPEDMQFIRLLTMGKPPVDAYMQAFGVRDRGYASQQAEIALTTPHIRKHYQQRLQALGVTPELIMADLMILRTEPCKVGEKVKTLDMLAKMINAYENNEYRRETGTDEHYQNLSPEELAQRIAEAGFVRTPSPLDSLEIDNPEL